jgi:aerobic-type carbon monoxide dehydrogenase small subunit (CoxS/CutS family)
MNSSPLKTISFQLNGKTIQDEVQSRLNLADFLRQQCHLTGTHVGCEHGVCGACTVMVEGRAVRSCLMLAVQVDQKAVVTVEGISPASGLSVLQESFWAEHGLQCGFCTPGVLISLTQLLIDNSSPSPEEIRDVLSGHLCRCTGYQNIVKACMLAAKRLREAPDLAQSILIPQGHKLTVIEGHHDH